MKVWKTVFAVFLSVFCLAMMVSSAVPSGSTVGGYDPQLDINHDGVIDMKDVGGVARSFSTSGDPTVPVNVTNWPSEMNVTVSDSWAENTYQNTIVGQSSWLFFNKTAGFRKVTVSFSGYVDAGTQTYNIYVGFLCGTCTYQVDSFSDTATSLNITPNPPGVSNYTTRIYEVTGSQIWICIWNPAAPVVGPQIRTTVSIFMTA
jgi:hypothetical protein